MSAVRNSRPSYAMLRYVIAQYASIDRVVRRARVGCEHLVDGFITHALSTEEQADVTRAIYDASPSERRAMFDWEVAWFQRSLPAAPARILIGGAGTGREVRWLQDAGYRVDAFEPTPSAARVLARVVRREGLASCGSYEDLLSAAAGRSNGLAPVLANRYDAVIAGWGSLSHLLDAQGRRSLFELCHRLCPDGPILASFFVAEVMARRGRARAWGARLGRSVGKLRGVAPTSPIHLRFLTNSGVVHGFTLEELEELGRMLGRRLAFQTWPYPHATWLPPDPTRPPIASQTPIGID